MTELCFASYVDAIHPALVKHTVKEDAAAFLLESVTGQEIVDSPKGKKKKDLKKDGTLSQLLRGVKPVPEYIRQATVIPEVAKGVVSYFRTQVAQDLNPHLKADLLDSFFVLIDNDITIPEARKESLKALHAGDDLELFLAETFIYAINRVKKPATEEIQQKISIPLLIFTLLYGISIYACTMYTMIKMEEISQPLMAFAFFFSIGLFVFLIGFYFFLWRRDI
ncbi:MAG: hypothetical protein J6S97_03315 [Bacteroidales bacterium]|nr:hypothetical protein [Bacteroidales bacterium]MBP5382755.1 hypothetical protein [Bacteroidales bacterium]